MAAHLPVRTHLQLLLSWSYPAFQWTVRAGLATRVLGRRAQLYAPRLMAVMADSGSAREKFVEGCRAVPSDAFLAWAPSMLSLLDEDVGDAVLPVLQVRTVAMRPHGRVMHLAHLLSHNLCKP